MAEPAATDTQQQARNAWHRLVELGLAALPPIASAIGIVTFVALIGGAIQWVRFWAAGLPADQAVRAMPKAELIVIGAVSLLAFLLLGLIIVLIIYLIDRQAVAELSTLRLLVGLTVLEMGAALIFVDTDAWKIVLLAIWIVVLGVVTARTLDQLPSLLSFLASRAELRAARERYQRAHDEFDDAQLRVQLTPPNGDTGGARSASLREAVVEHQAARREWRRALDHWAEHEALEIAALRDLDRPVTEDELEEALAGLEARERGQRDRFIQRARWAGVLIVTILIGALPLALSDSLRWVLAVLGIVAVLGGLNFMIARITPRFGWFGLAVFASVVLFGASLSAVRTIRSPKVQPIAVLSKSDQRPICGTYVTETDKRVYLARVVPRKSGDRTELERGRVFWVDLDDVITFSVGPLQKVKRAQARATELARELVAHRPRATPAGPKPVITTETVKRERGRRSVTVERVREAPAPSSAAPTAPNVDELLAGGSCAPPAE